MWPTVCGATQSVVRNLADSSETGPGTAAIGRRTWQVKYGPQTDRRWVGQVRTGRREAEEHTGDGQGEKFLWWRYEDSVTEAHSSETSPVFWALKAEVRNLFGVCWWFRCLMMNLKKLHTFLWKPVSATELKNKMVIAIFLYFIICKFISHNSDFVSRNSEKTNKTKL